MATTLPWIKPKALAETLDLGPGLEATPVREGLAALVQDPEVKAVVAFGSRARGDARSDSDLDLVVITSTPTLTPQQKLEGWRRYRERLGRVPVGVDLLVTGWQDAERMAGSRWHVMGDVALEGKLLYAAPEEDAALLLQIVRRHLAALKLGLDAAYPEEDWGFLGQQSLEIFSIARSF